MKTKSITILLLGIFASICLATQCEKEPLVMPSETQIGKNTFGCYVNDKLYVVENDRQRLIAAYIRNSGLLYFSTGASIGDMSLYLYNPKEKEYASVAGAMFSKNGKGWDLNSSLFADTNCGQIFITKFDTVNYIVSGTFDFSLRSATSFSVGGKVTYEEKNSETVRITSGRFDAQLDMYDN